MAYFLKKAKQQNRTYLAIYESFYSNDTKGTKHRCFKSLGSVDKLKESGIEDPISYYQNEVAKLNEEKNAESIKHIGDTTPELYLGYFLIEAIMNKLNVKEHIDYFKYSTSFDYDLYELLSSLIYARMINPCSKYKTFNEVLPNLNKKLVFSYDQLLHALDFIGNDYSKFIEIFNKHLKDIYGINEKKTYFDCTNFYFEIDREDDFRRKGPSKENRKDPIIGMGLLLDANQIPIGMELYPGNQSEKPILRNVIDGLKAKNQIEGKTIHVADKGLNCAQNIAFSKENGDGYIFSKSVKTLPETEKVWVLLNNSDWKEVKDKEGKLIYKYKSCVDKFPYTFEYEGKKTTIQMKEKRLLTYNPSLAAKKKYEINKLIDKATNLCLSKAKKSEYGEASKYVNFIDDKGNKAKVEMNQDMIEKDLTYAGYNLLVTSEVSMKDKDIYETYHNLWRIEESFKIMKSDLDARPVYLQKENTIKGHFLICYLSVLLERILQFYELGNKYSTNDIIKFIKGFKLIDAGTKYINTTKSTSFIKDLEKATNLPLTHFYLTQRQVNQIMKYKI